MQEGVKQKKKKHVSSLPRGLAHGFDPLLFSFPSSFQRWFWISQRTPLPLLLLLESLPLLPLNFETTHQQEKEKLLPPTQGRCYYCWSRRKFETGSESLSAVAGHGFASPRPRKGGSLRGRPCRCLPRRYLRCAQF